MNIKELREAGYKVRVTHLRRYYFLNHLGRPVIEQFARFALTDLSRALAKGGSTLVEVTMPSGEVLTGKAECSKKDNYCKKIGVAKALERVKTLLPNAEAHQ